MMDYDDASRGIQVNSVLDSLNRRLEKVVPTGDHDAPVAGATEGMP